VIAEASWDYHRGAREPVFQVLKSWFVSAWVCVSRHGRHCVRSLCGTSDLNLTVGIAWLRLNTEDTWPPCSNWMLAGLCPVTPIGVSGHFAEALPLTLTTLFHGGAYISGLANSCSLFCPFVSIIHPSEHSQHSLTHLAWLDHYIMRFKSIQVYCFEWWHLEALGDCVLLWSLLVTLGGFRHLDGLVQWGSSSRERCLFLTPMILRGSWPFLSGEPKCTLVDCSWLVDSHLVLVVRHPIAC
jgi:hypothetical protein